MIYAVDLYYLKVFRLICKRYAVDKKIDHHFVKGHVNVEYKLTVKGDAYLGDEFYLGDLTGAENEFCSLAVFIDLQHCYDSPMIIYCKGPADLNVEKVVGVVGTRNVTDYGKTLTDKVVEQLADDNVLVVSGLAYGVDTHAHNAALKNKLNTAAVLAHGFQTIYPPLNKTLARKIIDGGGCLLTEHISGTEPDRENFPKRNRIVAGMIDCLIVVESASKGGALITAEIANGYDREVFAFPGKIGDIYSEGCNKIIKDNKANILTEIDDLRNVMRWNETKKTVAKQMRMFRDFSEDEQKVIDVFGDDNIVYLDKIITETMLSPTKIASILLSLEFDGLLTALPGKRYQKL